jgi:hypothetical protein
MTDIFEMYMPKWPPTGLSYPTRISGDFHSALIAFTDTPELFGGEIRTPCRGRFQGRQGGALDRLLGWSIVRR